MKNIDCDACIHSRYEGDKLRCDIEKCNPDYDYHCVDCEKFSNCLYTQGESQIPCLDFDLIN